MEIKAVDFFLGALVGAALCSAAIFGAGRLRAWLGYSEAGRLKAENRHLKRRLAEKDHHIDRMLKETERLAEKLREERIIGEVAERQDSA